MKEKIGIVILGDTFRKSCFILEEGGGNQIYEFDPQTVSGNIDLDLQAKQYPARLTRKIVKFTVDKNATITSVSTLVFHESIHEQCGRGITLAEKSCVW